MSATFDDLSVVITTQLENNSARVALSLEELVVQMRASGATDDIIREALEQDLANAGRIFGAYKNSTKNSVKNAVLSAGNIASKQVYEQAGVVDFKWITLGMTGSCPDCNDRHAEIGTMEYFETVGLPKSGFSVCGANCQCQIVPEAYKGKGIDKPIIRGKGRRNVK